MMSKDPKTQGRICWLALGATGLISAVLLLWLNRGTTFFFDEMVWFSNLAGDNDLASILQPHNSHLIGTSRLLYLTIIDLVGPEYVVFRVLGVLSVLLCSALFYTWAKRRIGAVWALLPAILLLFFGSAWQHVVGSIGFTVTFSIALGIGALLALERDDRKGDVLACVLVSLSVFTYTVGLAYLVGVAISVLLKGGRFKRIWIFLVPLLLYTAWWLWAQQFDQGRTTIANAGHIVSFFGQSFAVMSGALTGVSIPFSRFGDAEPIAEAPAGTAGWIAAIVIGAALIWRIRRGGYSPTIYASLGVVLTYWLAAALSDPLYFGSQADAVRYLLPGTVGVLLVLVDAAKGVRIHGTWAVGLVAIFAFSLVMNLVFLRDGAAYLRSHSTLVRTNLAMLEVGNGWLPGGGPQSGSGVPRYQVAPVIAYLGYGPARDEYLPAVAGYGSPAFDLDEVRALSETERRDADSALLQTYALGLNPAEPPEDHAACKATAATDGTFPVPAGGVLLRPQGADPVALSLNRFSDPPGVPIGQAPAGEWSRVLIPTDRAPEDWYATMTAGEKAEICPVD